ncbi:MAG: UTP--glucose-1-phosphate uridylyltransferase [Candidatus Binataceae bacterium]
MKVRKAVIVAAGLGTRMLPASKIIPKELLPIVDRPAIQVVVEEAVASGIEEIIMVLSPGRTLARDHFSPAVELEEHLERRGKHELLEIIRRTNNLARFTIAEQREPLGLGHAVLQARAAVGQEPFAVFYPDDVVDAPRPLLAQVIDVAQRMDGPVVSLMRVAREDIPKYGIVAARHIDGRVYQLTGMVEKPAADQAPSDLAIIGRHVLVPEIFALLEQTAPGAGGEIQLTDALLALSRHRQLYGYEIDGIRYDVGDRAGFIAAQIGFGLKRPDLADNLRAYLKTLAIK